MIGEEGSGFEVESLVWEVKSVMDPNQDVKGFGPSQPIYLSWPEWFLWGWGLALAWVVGILMYKWISGLKRKKEIRSLFTHKTFRSPYNQYHWEMRKLTREYQSSHYMKESGGRRIRLGVSVGTQQIILPLLCSPDENTCLAVEKSPSV